MTPMIAKREVKLALLGGQNIKPPWFFATLEFIRTDMLALPIVEGLDVLEHGHSSLLPGSILSMKDFFAL
jgi:hypothetical protein